MRITFVCNEYPPRPQGGIGTFIYYLARGLKLLGHSITVAGMCDRDTEADDDGIRVVTRAASSARITLEDRRRFHSWLLSDVAANSTDVVEVPEFEGMLPFRFDACPVVVRLHQSQSGIALSGCRPPRPLIYWCETPNLTIPPLLDRRISVRSRIYAPSIPFATVPCRGNLQFCPPGVGSTSPRNRHLFARCVRRFRAVRRKTHGGEGRV